MIIASFSIDLKIIPQEVRSYIAGIFCLQTAQKITIVEENNCYFIYADFQDFSNNTYKELHIYRNNKFDECYNLNKCDKTCSVFNNCNIQKKIDCEHICKNCNFLDRLVDEKNKKYTYCILHLKKIKSIKKQSCDKFNNSFLGEKK